MTLLATLLETVSKDKSPLLETLKSEIGSLIKYFTIGALQNHSHHIIVVVHTSIPEGKLPFSIFFSVKAKWSVSIGFISGTRNVMKQKHQLIVWDQSHWTTFILPYKKTLARIHTGETNLCFVFFLGGGGGLPCFVQEKTVIRQNFIFLETQMFRFCALCNK